MKTMKLMTIAGLVLAAAALSAFENYNEAYKAGTQARKSKNHAEAGKAFAEAEKLASADKDKAQAVFMQALTRGDAKDYAGALAKLAELDKFEGLPQSHIVRNIRAAAGYCEQRKDYRKAAGFYEKAAAVPGIPPESQAELKASALNLTAKAFNAEKKFEEASAKALEAASVPGIKPDAALGLCYSSGNYAVKANKFDMAREAFRKGAGIRDVKNIPLKYHCLAQMGRTFTSEKKYDEALAAFESAKEFSKTSALEADRIYETANIYNLKKDFATAVKVIAGTDAVSGVPADKQLRAALFAGHCMNRAKKYPEAREFYRKALTFKNTTNIGQLSEAASQLVKTLYSEGKYREAADEAKTLSANAVYQANRRNQMLITAGDACKKLEKADESEMFYRQAAALPGADPQQKAAALNALVILSKEKREFDKAVAALEAILAIPGLEKRDPSWIAMANSSLADIYFTNRKDIAKAKEYIDRAKAVKGARWGVNKGLAGRIEKASGK